MLGKWRQFHRLWRIYHILSRYQLDKLAAQHMRSRGLRLLVLCNPYHWFNRTTCPPGEALRLALTALGPVFVKFGQTLSTRRDILPEDIADELAKLQDQVPPFDGEIAQKTLETIYQQPIDTLFTHFEATPLASASIAQVHAATLPDGKAVVIKLLRPHVEKYIKQDVAVLYLLANFATRYWKKARRFKAREIVAEFEQSLLSELDLLREAANASQLRRNFLHSPELSVPQIYWQYTNAQVVVMERIYGIPIRDKDALCAAGVNLQVLAERGLEIFLTQVFRDCFFHADMHPGNLFVDATTPNNPRYIAVDFGIMGTLSPMDQRYIAENFLAFFNRDYRRVAVLHLTSGWAPPGTRLDQLEMAIRAVCEPIFERPLAEISFGQLLLRLFQMAARFNIEIQPQLILLQKTLLNVEGLGRYLYPQLDLWKTAKPFLERWIKSQIGPRAFFNKVKENLPLWLEQLPEWPQLIYNSLQHLQKPPHIPHNGVTETKPITRIVRQQQGFWTGVAVTSALGLLIVFVVCWPLYPHL